MYYSSIDVAIIAIGFIGLLAVFVSAGAFCGQRICKELITEKIIVRVLFGIVGAVLGVILLGACLALKDDDPKSAERNAYGLGISFIALVVVIAAFGLLTAIRTLLFGSKPTT
jgi:uncharacterized membrane protein YeaQ/YmgE (transglycosylase-associated protein family)